MGLFVEHNKVPGFGRDKSLQDVAVGGTIGLAVSTTSSGIINAALRQAAGYPAKSFDDVSLRFCNWNWLRHLIQEVAAFVVLLIILLVKPYGLFGEVRIERI